MLTKTEAGMILAILDEKIPYIPIPHSREMALVAKKIRERLEIFHRTWENYKQAEKKIERKNKSGRETYHRLMEENRKVADLQKAHSFVSLSEEKPKRTMRKYVVRLDNGDYQLDFLLENKTWRDHGNRVVKWMEIPDDVDRKDDKVRSKKKR